MVRGEFMLLGSVDETIIFSTKTISVRAHDEYLATSPGFEPGALRFQGERPATKLEFLLKFLFGND